jgi:hypothetical protein
MIRKKFPPKSAGNNSNSNMILIENIDFETAEIVVEEIFKY